MVNRIALCESPSDKLGEPKSKGIHTKDRDSVMISKQGNATQYLENQRKQTTKLKEEKLSDFIKMMFE